jgi:hypothetical protein
MLAYICTQITTTKKLNKMEAKQFIKAELKRREDLINDIDFRELCAKHAKQIGITLDEWNKNKMPILMYFANEFCRIENQAV